MKTGFLSAVLALAVLAGPVVAQNADDGIDTSDTDMIVGGWPAKVNEWPWQVRLYSDAGDSWGFCGGSIIDNKWVLTAAHCLPGVRSLVIGYGSVDRDKQTRVASAAIYVHPDYNPDTSANDIALIKLSKAVKFGKGAAKVPLANKDLFEASYGETAYVTGWGQLLDKQKLDTKYPDGNVPWKEIVPMRLMEVDVRIQSLEQCRANYGGNDSIPTGHVCAGYAQGGKDSCQGDSGGPLVIADPNSKTGWSQLGVVSFGIGCALPKFYGAYTRVDYFRGWLNGVMKSN